MNQTSDSRMMFGAELCIGSGILCVQLLDNLNELWRRSDEGRQELHNLS
jgi:hypothetical protein